MAARISVATGANLDQLMKERDGSPLYAYRWTAADVWLKHLGARAEDLPMGKDGLPAILYAIPPAWSLKVKASLRKETTGEDGKLLMFRGKPLWEHLREVWEAVRAELKAGPPEREFTRECHEEWVSMWKLYDTDSPVKDKPSQPGFSATPNINVAALLNKLTLSQDIYWQLSADTRNLVSKLDSAAATQELRQALISDLNRISRAPIYDSQRFAGIELSAESRELLRRNPRGEELTRLNRMLLEDAFPLEIPRAGRSAAEVEAERYGSNIGVLAGQLCLAAIRGRQPKVRAVFHAMLVAIENIRTQFGLDDAVLQMRREAYFEPGEIFATVAE